MADISCCFTLLRIVERLKKNLVWPKYWCSLGDPGDPSNYPTGSKHYILKNEKGYVHSTTYLQMNRGMLKILHTFKWRGVYSKKLHTYKRWGVCSKNYILTNDEGSVQRTTYSLMKRGMFKTLHIHKWRGIYSKNYILKKEWETAIHC